jgi:hypothetical protein
MITKLMLKYTFYIFYNLFLQLGVLLFFLYANTFLNEFFVPENLMWENNLPRIDFEGLGAVAIIKTSVLIVEAAVLILLIYLVNKIYLKYNYEKKGDHILIWTIKINIILSLLFITFLIYGSFRGFLW